MKSKKLVLTILMSLLAVVAFNGCDKHELAITQVSDIKQAVAAKVGAMTGTTGETLAFSKFPQATVKSFDDIMDAVAAIKSGQLDAIVTAYPTALQVTKKNQELMLLPEPLDHEDTAIAFRKDSADLLQQVNEIIAELKADGTLQSMQKRWLKPDLSPYEEVSVPLPVSGEVLKIGVSATREPLTFVDKYGKVSGHDGELARVIGQKLKRPVEFFNMKFMALIPALQSGKVDMILTGMTATAERKKHVNFSEPYFSNTQVVLVKKQASNSAPLPAVTGSNNGGKFASAADLKTSRLGVLLGSAYDKYATDNFPQAKIMQYNTASDLVLAVKADKVDAAMFDEDPLREILRLNPDIGLLGAPLFSFPVGVGISKQNEALRLSFNQFLAQIKRNGTHDDMLARWSKAGGTQMPLIESTGTNGMLRATVNDVGLPFVAVLDNQLLGFDIELLKRFAAYEGKTIEFSNADFSSLVAAVASGKADLIASSIFITDERKKQINFSDPYYEMGARLFALKQNIDDAAIANAAPVVATSEAQNAAIAPADNVLRSVDDLKHKRIAVLLGSVHDSYAMQHFPQAVIMQYKSPSDILLAVKSGKVDAAIYTRETLVEILHADPELALLGDSLQTYPIGIGFNKDKDVLREQFNAFLKTIKQDGTYDEMVSRWIKNNITTMPHIENSEKNGVLIAGNVSDKGLPFTVVKNNQLIGFDIELAERFGAYLGKKVQYADMEFGNLIVAASTNKIDMIVSTLMLTDERKQKIDFSDPYYALGANAFALRKNIAHESVAAPAQSQPSESQPASKLPSFLQNTLQSFESNIIHEDRYLLILSGLQVTVMIAIFATIFGTLLGGLICFMRMSPHAWLSTPAKIYISILRGMPVLVLLMLIFYVVFASVNISPVLVAVIAFGMNFAAYVSEIFRSGVNGVDKGQVEAGIAMGFTKLTTFIYITLPQTIQRILPVYKGEFISLVKMTSIVGYIAVQDLTKASDIIRSRTFDAFFPLVMIAILYFLISWLLLQSLEYLERRTDPKYKRQKSINA
jgi:polar amino acid transport system substrate-binding protein